MKTQIFEEAYRCATFMTLLYLVCGAQTGLSKFILCCFGSLSAPLLFRQSVFIVYVCYNLCAQQKTGLSKFFRMFSPLSINQSVNQSKALFGFHGRACCCLTKNRCAYVAHQNTLAKRAFLFIFVLKRINFRLCPTPGALLDRNLLTPYIFIILVERFSNRMPLNLCFMRFLANTNTCTVWKLFNRSLCLILVQLPC